MPSSNVTKRKKPSTKSARAAARKPRRAAAPVSRRKSKKVAGHARKRLRAAGKVKAAVKDVVALGMNRVNMVELDGVMVQVFNQSLTELMRDPTMLEPTKIILPLLAAAGRVTLLASREKGGKTTLMAYAVVCKSRGLPLFGEPVKRGRVLWVGLEESPVDAIVRFKEMGADTDMIGFISRLRGKGGLNQLRAEVKSCNPELIVLDSLAAFGGGTADENNASAVQAMLQPVVDFIHDSGIALVLLHHATKASTGTGSYRGSAAIGAAVDMILEMAEIEHQPTGRRISARGRFDIPSYEIMYDKKSRVFTKLGEVKSKEEVSEELLERIVQWLRENPNKGKARIRNAMGGNATRTDEAIDQLVKEEKIRHEGHRGGYVAV